ncbi:hypothetical protein ACNKHL_13145 [Shigella flexneri]
MLTEIRRHLWLTSQPPGCRVTDATGYHDIAEKDGKDTFLMIDKLGTQDAVLL